MRNIQKLIVFTLLASIFSCNNDDVLKEANNTEKRESSTQQKTNNVKNNYRNNSQNNVLQYSQSELIVHYKLGTTNATKNSLRQIHGVVSFEICQHCPDEDIEKWNFGGQIDIEPKKGVIENDPNDDGLYPIQDVDYEFKFATSSYNNFNISSAFETGYISFIKEINDGITIAVIDTGIDTSLPVFTEPFLFNASETDLEGVLSGWDFVNNTNDPYDDNPGKHGTVISKIIEQELYPLGVKFQIMPLKAFNHEGKASYFDALCATNLALTYADVVNMSFGWYDDGFGDFTSTIFSTLITEHPEVVIITSAGNDGFDNDIISHYPSNYSQNHLLSVAASNHTNSNIASFSNYGGISVDYFASGHVYFLDSEMYGTSFSAPVITAATATALYDPTIPSSTMDEIIFALIDRGENTTELGFNPDKPVYHSTLIEALD